MPREIAHFLAVDSVVDRLPSLKALVRSQKMGLEALYLGSVTPDSPYYTLFGEGEEVAEFIHGRNGNDTFSLLRSLIGQPKTCTKEIENLLFLFSIGILTHIVMDAVMHPFINLLSGDYYSKDSLARKQARTLHRRLETDLDFYLLRSKRPKYISLINLRASLGGDLGELSTYLDLALEANGQNSTYKYYWLSHSFIGSLFNKRVFAKYHFLPSEIYALCGQGREPSELFSIKKRYPEGENLYFKYEGAEIDLFELYLLAQDSLLEQLELFIESPTKYLTLRGPSLVDGTV